MPFARYDGIAEWYDAYVRDERSQIRAAAQTALRTLLGRGTGRALDLCCGTGAHAGVLTELGWTLVGVDVSADQLAVARREAGALYAELVHADARALPFADGAFDAVAALFVSTDTDDWPAVVAEATRTLRAGAPLVHVGVHPCFIGHFAERGADRRVLHPGYRRRGWSREGPGIGPGIRSRVGEHHITLADTLNAFVDAGLAIERVHEPGDDDFPALIAIAARR